LLGFRSRQEVIGAYACHNLTHQEDEFEENGPSEAGPPFITRLGPVGQDVDVIAKGFSVPDAQPDDPECWEAYEMSGGGIEDAVIRAWTVGATKRAITPAATSKASGILRFMVIGMDRDS